MGQLIVHDVTRPLFACIWVTRHTQRGRVWCHAYMPVVASLIGSLPVTSNMVVLSHTQGLTNQVPDLSSHLIPYSRKLSREKTFANFKVREPSAKVFSTNFWGMLHSFMLSFKKSVNVFSMKFSLPTNLRKFSPSKIYRYKQLCSWSNSIVSGHSDCPY